jgi:hypothetical protein
VPHALRSFEPHASPQYQVENVEVQPLAHDLLPDPLPELLNPLELADPLAEPLLLYALLLDALLLDAPLLDPLLLDPLLLDALLLDALLLDALLLDALPDPLAELLDPLELLDSPPEPLLDPLVLEPPPLDPPESPGALTRTGPSLDCQQPATAVATTPIAALDTGRYRYHRNMGVSSDASRPAVATPRSNGARGGSIATCRTRIDAARGQSGSTHAFVSHTALARYLHALVGFRRLDGNGMP